MEHILFSFFFHIFCAMLFSIIYYKMDSTNFQFSTSDYRQPNYIDFLSFSTTVQAGVGISNLRPNSELCNILY